MSVFQVQLNNISQGVMDLNPSTATPITANLYGNLGAEMNPSIQRTIYVAGPNRIYRKLVDGAQFTDCNYWKQFAYPQVPLDQAFITVITDDGSVYSNIAAENTYPLVTNINVANGSTYTTNGNSVNYLTTYGAYAVFVQVTNSGGTAVKCEINGNSSAIFDLSAGETQVFNTGDLTISSLSFANTVSGGSTSAVQILASLQTVCNS